MAGTDDYILTTLLTLFILLLAAKIAGEMARRLGIAAVIGEILAGVILAPTLLGGIHVFGVQLITVNDSVRVFSELGAVILLFLVGLETRFIRFVKSGLVATVVATGGVVIPFVLAYYFSAMWGYNLTECLLVGASLTATSVAITVKVLKDIGRSKTSESDILVGAAVIDDVLGLVVLAIVLAMIGGTSPDLMSVAGIAAEAVVFWIGLTLVGVFVISKVIDKLCPMSACGGHADGPLTLLPAGCSKKHCTLPCNGSQEASTLALCLGFAYLAGMAGLAPILGAFSAGMSIAETRILRNIRELTEKINIVTAPMFFVIIGTCVDLTGLTLSSFIFAAILTALAMLGKIVGCGLPVLLINRNAKQAILVGIGMMSRGEVGLIIAGIGITSGIFGPGLFSAVVLMVIVTTIVTPVLLTAAYDKLNIGPSGDKQAIFVKGSISGMSGKLD